MLLWDIMKKIKNAVINSKLDEDVARDDRNIEGYQRLITPNEIRKNLQITQTAISTVRDGRTTIKDSLRGKDKRIVLLCGPCSIHDNDAAEEYASKLKNLSEDVKDVFYIIMRTFFEKPRTEIGWKGLIDDPDLKGMEGKNKGLFLARKLLLQNAEKGLPSGTEFLDPFVPQYISDLISWGGIGARTVESQTHRAMASGLSMPIGFKNSTNGNITVAINAVVVAKHRQEFFGSDLSGKITNILSKGNDDAHIVLRGGNDGPNYNKEKVQEALNKLKEKGLFEKLIIDCSHGNSKKDHNKQPEVFFDVIKQIYDGNTGIFGLMLESNIAEGRQEITSEELRYGVSVTDSCIGWDCTEEIVKEAAKILRRKN